MKNQIHTGSLFLFLCLYGASCSPGDTKTTTNKPAPVQAPASAEAGKPLYIEKCASCHGNDGTAGIANAANLQASTLDSLSVIRTITHGKDAMPAFVDQLGTGEIEQIASYVRSLRK